MILNAYWEPLDFELPPAGSGEGNAWRRWIDTTLESPFDIVEWQQAPYPSSTSPTTPEPARSWCSIGRNDRVTPNNQPIRAGSRVGDRPAGSLEVFRWESKKERPTMKIVVIGGSGLIGSKLVTKLREQGTKR